MKEYYRQIYYEACDLLSGELQRRFETKHIPSVVSMEQALMKPANKKNFQSEVKEIGQSCFKNDVDLSDLSTQLPLLCDVVKKAAPEMKAVTSIHTICDAMDRCSRKCYLLHTSCFAYI